METWLIVTLSALLNGAVTWGVVRTELKYLRRDVDLAHRRIDFLEHGRELQRDSA